MASADVTAEGEKQPKQVDQRLLTVTGIAIATAMSRCITPPAR